MLNLLNISLIINLLSIIVLGILADIFFLKDEALFMQTHADIAHQRNSYAMLISPQDETHVSITLMHILNDTPQEYRNTTLGGALKLLYHINYECTLSHRKYMVCERTKRFLTICSGS